MRSGVIIVVLLVTFVTVPLPLVQGLKCYHCVSNSHPNPGSDPKTPAAHDDCLGGYDLPDNIIQTCSEDNANNFLAVNMSGNQEGWRRDFACAANEVAAELTGEIEKTTGSDEVSHSTERSEIASFRVTGIRNGNQTHRLAFIRSCTLALYPTAVKLESHCESDWKLLQSGRYFYVRSCYCYEDKCNFSTHKKETIENVTVVTEVVGAGSHDVVSLDLGTLVSIALAFQYSYRL